MTTATHRTTQELIGQHFHQRLNTFSPTAIRLSESGACPRKRVMTALGYGKEAFSDSFLSYLELGHMVEDWMIGILAQEHTDIVRQLEIPHPYSDEPGHADAYSPSARKLWDIKSTGPSQKEHLPKPEHIKQVQAYLHFGRKAGVIDENTEGELIYVVLERGKPIEPFIYPVMCDETTGEAIEADTMWIAECVKAESIPPVPDGHKPETHPCQFWTKTELIKCPFWDNCWGGYTDDTAEETPELESIVAEYAALKNEVSQYSKAASTNKKRIDELQKQIAARLDGMDSNALVAGGIEVKRTLVGGGESYDMKSAIEAGVIPADVLAKLEAFKKVSQGHYRWYVKKGESA